MRRLLVISSLYPNPEQERHGIFVETRLRRLLDRGGYCATVLAPVPWFPFRSARFGRYGAYARVPASECRNGVTVLHPRYFHLPWLGFYFSPVFMFVSLWWARRRLRDAFDVVDAHYFYPDGAAAALLAKSCQLPLAVTARGSDINVLADYRLPRWWIRRTAVGAQAVIAVSAALKQRLSAIGVPAAHIAVIRNGVDLDRFHPGVAGDDRRSGGLSLLAVGNLVPLKGVDLLLRVLARLPEAQLTVVGEGSEGAALRSLAHQLGVQDRVSFTGNLPQEQLVDVYRAADVLLLASSNEGMPNVVLEALACGTPVIAAPVGGVPEVLSSPALGVLLPERSEDAFVAALSAFDRAAYPADRVREAARGLSWERSIEQLDQLLGDIPGLADDSAGSLPEVRR